MRALPPLKVASRQGRLSWQGQGLMKDLPETENEVPRKMRWRQWGSAMSLKFEAISQLSVCIPPDHKLFAASSAQAFARATFKDTS